MFGTKLSRGMQMVDLWRYPSSDVGIHGTSKVCNKNNTCKRWRLSDVVARRASGWLAQAAHPQTETWGVVLPCPQVTTLPWMVYLPFWMVDAPWYRHACI